MKTQCAVYMIKNIINGRMYIGSSINVEKRFREHQAMLARGVHHSKKMQLDWIELGRSVFEFFVIEPVYDLSKKKDHEQVWIDYYRSYESGYNVHPSAHGPRGSKTSEETKKKQSESKMGHVVTSETRMKISSSHTGKKLAPESIKKRTASRDSYRTSEATKIKMSQSQKGKKLSDETRLKMSESRKEYLSTDEGKAKMASAWDKRRMKNENA